MTDAEWNLLVETRDAAVTTRALLAEHIAEEERLWRRRAGLAPWLSSFAALAALLVSLFNLVR
jgi:hypothetical protein